MLLLVRGYPCALIIGRRRRKHLIHICIFATVTPASKDAVGKLIMAMMLRGKGRGRGGGMFNGSKSLHAINGQANGSADEGCAERGGGNGTGESAAFFRWR